MCIIKVLLSFNKLKLILDNVISHKNYVIEY